MNKGNRRYPPGPGQRPGLGPRTAGEFDGCLADPGDLGVPLAAPAARVYLDVSFFLPFPDGNARATRLTLYFTLLRDHVVLRCDSRNSCA